MFRTLQNYILRSKGFNFVYLKTAINNPSIFFSHQSPLVKPLKLQETLLTKMWEYTYLGMKGLLKNQMILFGKFSLEIDSFSILVAKMDIESVQNQV